MNCKAGDLVRYVGANKQNRPNVYGWVGVTIKYTTDSRNKQCWEVTPPLPGGPIQVVGGTKFGDLITDENLRPIRDTLGKDETLTWLDVPSEKVTA